MLNYFSKTIDTSSLTVLKYKYKLNTVKEDCYRKILNVFQQLNYFCETLFLELQQSLRRIHAEAKHDLTILL